MIGRLQSLYVDKKAKYFVEIENLPQILSLSMILACHYVPGALNGTTACGKHQPDKNKKRGFLSHRLQAVNILQLFFRLSFQMTVSVYSMVI